MLELPSSTIESGISYQPSTVKMRKVEYIESMGLLKYYGERFLNSTHVTIEMMKMMIRKAIMIK